jgi:hydrogenase maturation protease
MNRPRILIAGIGNLFQGDDYFGCEVAQRLARRQWPEGVEVQDFGIRGHDLAYKLLDGYDVVVLIDATQRGSEPGTVYVIEPDLSERQDSPANGSPLDAHSLDPQRVIQMVKSMGGEFERLLLVGCEPADLGSIEEGKMGLSAPVAAAVVKAEAVVVSLVSEVLDGAASAGRISI